MQSLEKFPSRGEVKNVLVKISLENQLNDFHAGDKGHSLGLLDRGKEARGPPWG